MTYEYQKGLFLHSTLFITNKGIPQSVFHQHYWSRSPQSLSKRTERKHLPIEQKESSRWVSGFNKFYEFFEQHQSNMVINICDREGDIYELLAKKRPENGHYIIRNSNNRRVIDKLQEKEKLWERIDSTPAKGTYTLEIVDQKTKEKRTARIEVKYASAIELTPPYRKINKLSPISVNLVYACEVNPPQDITPVKWRLLTSLEITSIEQALTIIKYYSYRWRIERLHYVLKQGMAVEDLQLAQQQNLKNAIALYSLIACKILNITYLAKESPQASVTAAGYTENQYKWLYSYLETSYRIKINSQIKESD